MHSMHGFQQECTTKYDKDVYELFNEAFAQLPIATVVNDKVAPPSPRSAWASPLAACPLPMRQPRSRRAPRPYLP